MNTTHTKNNANLENHETGERTILRFDEGIYGFEDVKEYVLLQEDDAHTIWYLQAAHSAVPCLIVIDPYTIVDDYAPVISDADLAYLGSPKEEDLCFLVVAVLKDDYKESVANLKSPIVINAKTKHGKQIILENNNYPIRYKLFGNE